MGKVVSKARRVRLAYQSRIGESVPLSRVAEETGIDRMTLTRIERNQTTRADFEVLAKLCSYYGVTIADLLEYDPNERRATVSPAPSLAGVQ